ncbi:MAG: alpha/beta fold hydrolase [Bacillota bacterium]|nr:alpha/beta fold hydrolase [Bacillota bacterium]
MLLRALCSVLCLGLLISTLSCKPAPKPLTEEELVGLAKQFAGFFSGGKPAEAVNMMDATMKAAMPEAKLIEAWASLTGSLGAYQPSPGTRCAEEAGYRVVYVTLAFAIAEVDMKVVFDTPGKVAGLWFGVPRVAGSGMYSPPAYASQDSFTETECVVGTGQWQLPATLTMPNGSGPFPAVVLVHGSGPNDRDETVGPNKPFKDLAWGLASKGIAVLRYEKRTRQYQGQIGDPAAFTLDQEIVDDAVCAVALLRATDKVNPARVFVLGHSLGGMTAPRIAARLGAGQGGAPKGLILMAANARDMLVLIVEQTEYLAGLDGQISDTETAQLAQLRDQVSQARAGKLKPGAAVLGASQAYWTDILAYDQVAAAKSLDVPMLFMQGERDYQVTMEDFGLWKESLAGRAALTFKSYPALNHLFIAGEGRSNPTEYGTAGNVAREVVDDIAAWVKGL